MALGVCMLFDRRAEQALRELWARLEQQGVPTLRSHTHGRHLPHMSYVVLVEWAFQELRTEIETLPGRGEFDVTFDAVGLFRRGRVSLVPACPSDLPSRQGKVVEAARRGGCVIHQHYEPGKWLPHCAIAPRAQLDQLHIVAATVYDVLPLTARVTRSALIDSSTGARWPLDVLP